MKPFDFIARRLQIAGSLIGGIAETQEMLDFCAEHNLMADVEVIKAEEVNEAWKNLTLNSNPKARYVIDVKNTMTPDSAWECVPVVYENKHVVHDDADIMGSNDPNDRTGQAAKK